MQRGQAPSRYRSSHQLLVQRVEVVHAVLALR